MAATPPVACTPPSPSDIGALMTEVRKGLDDSWTSVQVALARHRAEQERLLDTITNSWPSTLSGSYHEEEAQMWFKQKVETQAGSGPQTQSNDGVSSSDTELAVEKRPSKTRAIEKAETLASQGSIDLEFEDLIQDLKEGAGKVDSPIKYLRLEMERYMLMVMVWFRTLEEPERSGCLATFITTISWRILVNLTILANSIYMWYSVDFVAANLNDGYKVPAETEVVEQIFFSFFFIELVLRLTVHRLYFFVNEDRRWNIFETALVLMSSYDFIISMIEIDDGAQGGGASNAFFLRTLRVLRVARTLRILRVVRFASPLRRMLASVLGSFNSLLWAFVMVTFVFGIFGIAIVQTISGSLLDEPYDETDQVRSDLLVHFGSVSIAMLSYYMATSGGNDWSMYFDLLLEKTAVGAALFVLVVAFTQFALMNILTGIFVENAMKVAAPDRQARAFELRQENIAHFKEFRRCLEEVDIDSSGSITLEELRTLSADPRVHAIFSSMDLDVKDAELFFEMVRQENQGSEDVDLDFLIEACMKMRGPASSVDIQLLTHKVNLLHAEVKRQETGFAL